MRRVLPPEVLREVEPSLQAMGELAHDGDRHGRELLDQPQEQLLGDPERDEARVGAHRGSPRHVAEDRDLAEEIVGPQHRDHHRAARSLDDHLGLLEAGGDVAELMRAARRILTEMLGGQNQLLAELRGSQTEPA